MTPTSISECIAHLHALYPKSKTHWPVARQQALADKLKPVDIDVAQFKALASDVAMVSKSTWCPPENVIVQRLAALTERRHAARLADGPHKPAEELHSMGYWARKYPKEWAAHKAAMARIGAAPATGKTDTGARPPAPVDDFESMRRRVLLKANRGELGPIKTK